MSESHVEPIRIEMTDDATELHRRVGPFVQRYVESPSDFEATTHGVIQAHISQCSECQQALNRHIVEDYE